MNTSDPCDNGGNITKIKSLIDDLCLGKTWCPIFVNQTTFGNPCSKGSSDTHQLTVRATCASGAGGFSCANSDPGLYFAGTLSSNAVLQRAPQSSQITGTITPGTFSPGATTVSVALVNTAGSKGVPTALVTAPVSEDGTWKAVLPPQEPLGWGNYNVTASCTGCYALAFLFARTLQNITFGDVWQCSGQSNVQLSMYYTFGLNASTEALKAGNYSNVRYFQMEYSPQYAAPMWVLPYYPADGQNYQWTPGPGLVGNDGGDWLPGCYALCWYFAQSLTDIMASANAVVPVGVIAAAQGGTTIEQWTPKESQASCADISCLCDTPGCNHSQPFDPIVCTGNGRLFNGLAAPLVNTTVKGWIWHQGENNAGGSPGNSRLGTGYSCMIKTMVASWRKLWSETPGTTPQDAPFGIATLPYWEAEGSPQNIAGHQWAHTASHGVLPNEDLPNTFMAMGHDIGDPWESQHCKQWGCCVPPWEPLGSQCWEDHRGEWDSRTPFFMGGIHARTKLEMGYRFAHAAWYGVAYRKGSSPAIGPVVSGCRLDSVGKTLVITFNATLLVGFPVTVRPNAGKLDTNTSVGNFTSETSITYILVNASLPDAADDGSKMNKGGPGPYGYWPWEGGNEYFPGAYPSPSGNGGLQGLGWVAVAVTAGPAPNQISVDLSQYPQIAGLPITALRHGGSYAMCCGQVQSTWPGGASRPCPPKSCPVVVEAPSGTRTEILPAVGFVARIDQASGKCACMAPQVCDE